jgi:hypothetical protein
MRIDADDSLGERLDKVKAELCIGGKGHSETIRRLIDHYEQNRDLNKILDHRMTEIQKRKTQSLTQKNTTKGET